MIDLWKKELPKKANVQNNRVFNDILQYNVKSYFTLCPDGSIKDEEGNIIQRITINNGDNTVQY
jgi:hypothetical protein